MAATMPRVAVLLATRNDEDFLATTLLSVFHEAAAYREAGGAITICVVNDGSSDGTASVIDGMRHLATAPFTVITRAEEKGTAASLNEAFVACGTGCDLVLRADADARFIQSGWLQQMVGLLSSDSRIGIVAPLSVFPDGIIDAHGVNYLPVGRTIELQDREYATQAIAPLVEVDAVLGVYSLMRAADWEVDSSYSTWRDDEDQCLALRRRGRKCFSMGALEVVHYARMRWARVSDRITISAWQRRHTPRPPTRPSRMSELKTGTELIAAGVLPTFAKRTIRKMLPAPKPAPAQVPPPSLSEQIEAEWRQDSLHFAHKWGFPSDDPWTHVPPDKRHPSQTDIEGLAQSRAGHLLRGRYTADGIAEAREIVERYVRTQDFAAAR
jgi:GT2 family glycosyltransferase